MFESQQVSQKIDKAEFRARVPELREALLEAQFELRERSEQSLVVVLAGEDGAGKAAIGNRINEWMDSRFIATHGFRVPSDLERSMPLLWRYWLALPMKGSTSLLFGSWYNDLLQGAIFAKASEADLENELRLVNRFERMLAQEGVLLAKIWLHGDDDRGEEDTKVDPEERWQNLRGAGSGSRKIVENAVRITSTAHAPWVVVNSSNARYRDLRVGEMLLEMLRGSGPAPTTGAHPMAKLETVGDTIRVADRVDLSARIDEDDYEARLAKYQKRLQKLIGSKAFANRSALLVFEGSDAAGKGGTIRRITKALDPRSFQVRPYSAPNAWEAAYPYLWRFWTSLPTPGRLAIFDRSYYGRVLVERVEGLATPAEWTRAYSEISDFEDQLIDSGVIVAKFWLTISPEEQARRFEKRKDTPYKRHKITDEDWRNRKRWDDYERAVVDMVDRTSRIDAPWYLVSTENKRAGRVEVLKLLCKQLKLALAED